MVIGEGISIETPGSAIATVAAGAGSVEIRNHGFIESQTSSAIDLSLDNAIVYNGGEISALGGIGLDFSGDGLLSFQNSGTVSAADTAIDLIGFGGDAFIQNSGLIEVQGGHIVNLTSSNSTSEIQILNSGEMLGGTLELGAGAGSTFVNTGLVLNLEGIAVRSTGVGLSNLYNSGEITTADGEIAIRTSLGFTEFVNDGIINGGIYSYGAHRLFENRGVINGDISYFDLTGSLVNSGTIHGDLTLSGRRDTVLNSGVIEGDINLSYGFGDRYEATGNGLVTGRVSSIGLNVTMIGADANDHFVTTRGDSILSGNGGDDTLEGGSGHDLLDGGAGDDGLMGGEGADRLTGGTGDDTFSGGEGADVFVFHTAAGTFSGFNIVQDFEDGTDLVDLSDLGLTAADFEDTILPAFSNFDGDTLLDLRPLGGSGWVLFEGVSASFVTVDDFIF